MYAMTHCALACTYICAHTPPRPRSTALHLCQLSHLHPNSVRHRQAYRGCHSPRPRSPGCRLSSFVCVSLDGNFWPGAGAEGCSCLSVCLSVSLFFFVVLLLTSVTSVHVLGPCKKSMAPAGFPRICIVYRAISQR